MRRPMSAYSGASMRSQPGFDKAPAKTTGGFEALPGIGPFAPTGAAKNFVRPQYRGRKPSATGIFSAKTEFQPTIFSELYHQGALPCKVEFKGKEYDTVKGHGTNPAIHWLVKDLKKVDVARFFPVFITGLQEKTDPQMLLSYQGLQEMIEVVPVKTLIKHTKIMIFPLKENLKSLDDQVCIKTLQIILLLCQRSDKFTENLVQYFHILLPTIEILRNKQGKFVNKSLYGS